MTEEEILEMGAKPKRTRAKALTREELEAMFAKHDEEILKKVSDKCETCSHHDCECPGRIDAANDRMDVLDENDEKLRQGINESHRDLEEKLNEEHRLRVASEAKVDALIHTNNMNADAIIEQRAELSRMKSDNLKLGIMAGICLGVCLVVMAIFLVG